MFIHDTPSAFFGRNMKITSDILERWFVEFSGSLEDFQSYLLEQTFDNALFASCCIRIKYRESFLKTVLTWIEQHDRSAVNDRWYELIVDFASRTSAEQDWCHTIYPLSNQQAVIHRQSTAMLSHGLTGLSSWPASLCLGDYLMERIELVDHKHILELGAGSGLLGLALLKSSEKISSYTFTDYSPMILNLLQQNVVLNFPEDLLNTRIRVEELDWSHPVTDGKTQNRLDLILATDVVYDPSVIEDLVKTIDTLLSMNPHCSAYVANAIRNPLTYDQFRQALNRSPLNIRSVHKDDHQSIEILQISR